MKWGVITSARLASDINERVLEQQKQHRVTKVLRLVKMLFRNNGCPTDDEKIGRFTMKRLWDETKCVCGDWRI